MALKPLYSNREPVGFYDGLDTHTFVGGEVVGLTYVSSTGTDVHAADVGDGYVSFSQKKRPAVTKTLQASMRPLFLADEGTSGYGTLFGQLVGSSTGTVQLGSGTVLGPNTAAGSGKVTCWQGPGHYAVTLDAVAQGAGGLQPTNLALAGGDALYATSGGLLTPTVGSAFEAVVVGRFIEFTDGGSKVTTPHSLISAKNSPSGNTDWATGSEFTQAVIFFNLE